LPPASLEGIPWKGKGKAGNLLPREGLMTSSIGLLRIED